MSAWTYVIATATGHGASAVAVKIGKAVDIRKRMAQLQTGNSEHLHLLGATRILERELHARYASYRRDPKHEWFDLPLVVYTELIRTTLTAAQYDAEAAIAQQHTVDAKAQLKDVAAKEADLAAEKDQLICSAVLKTGPNAGKRCPRPNMIKGGMCGIHASGSAAAMDAITSTNPSQLPEPVTSVKKASTLEDSFSKLQVRHPASDSDSETDSDQDVDPAVNPPVPDGIIYSKTKYETVINGTFQVKQLSALFQSQPPATRPWRTYAAAYAGIAASFTNTTTLMMILYAKYGFIYCGLPPGPEATALIDAVLANPLAYVTRVGKIGVDWGRWSGWGIAPIWQQIFDDTATYDGWFLSNVATIIGTVNNDRIQTLGRTLNVLGHIDEVYKLYQADPVCAALLERYYTTLKTRHGA